MFRRSKPQTHEQLQEKAKRALLQLQKREKQFDTVVSRLQQQLVEAHKLLKKEKEQYDAALEEARITISKYDKEVDSLRDIIKVNEKTIEAQDASLNRLRELWKAETAIEVRRKLGAEDASQ